MTSEFLDDWIWETIFLVCYTQVEYPFGSLFLGESLSNKMTVLYPRVYSGYGWLLRGTWFLLIHCCKSGQQQTCHRLNAILSSTFLCEINQSIPFKLSLTQCFKTETKCGQILYLNVTKMVSIPVPNSVLIPLCNLISTVCIVHTSSTFWLFELPAASFYYNIIRFLTPKFLNF